LGFFVSPSHQPSSKKGKTPPAVVLPTHRSYSLLNNGLPSLPCSFEQEQRVSRPRGTSIPRGVFFQGRTTPPPAGLEKFPWLDLHRGIRGRPTTGIGSPPKTLFFPHPSFLFPRLLAAPSRCDSVGVVSVLFCPPFRSFRSSVPNSLSVTFSRVFLSLSSRSFFV